ncbi:MAG: ComF family protein [Ardenticatenales bacterium]|nr:ComF family protein [Ardenticatenales bacterium]
MAKSSILTIHPTGGAMDWQAAWRFFGELFFPPTCVGCQASGERLCERCLAAILLFEEPRCPRCDMPQVTRHAAPCAVCRASASQLDGMRVVGPHAEPLRRAIHALKYEHQPQLAQPLGTLLAQRWAVAGTAIDVVGAVPLHEARRKERGYNQAELLADRLAAERGLAVAHHAVQRIRATPPQVGLDRAARQSNVDAAFRAAASVVGQRWLLVDDVCTTGATLEATAKALRHAGAREVWAIVLARPVAPDAQALPTSESDVARGQGT